MSSKLVHTLKITPQWACIHIYHIHVCWHTYSNTHASSIYLYVRICTVQYVCTYVYVQYSTYVRTYMHKLTCSLVCNTWHGHYIQSQIVPPSPFTPGYPNPNPSTVLNHTVGTAFQGEHQSCRVVYTCTYIPVYVYVVCCAYVNYILLKCFYIHNSDCYIHVCVYNWKCWQEIWFCSLVVLSNLPNFMTFWCFLMWRLNDVLDKTWQFA